MFTGIVEELGEVVSVTGAGDSVRLSVRAPTVTADVAHGDSVAVDGCCLTVAERSADVFTADVMRESLSRTSLGRLAPGSAVNLERAARMSTRLGGHLVQGHVDAVGTVLERNPGGAWQVLRLGLPERLVRYVAAQGSIAVDGVSLTVVDVTESVPSGPSFTVSLIPTTLQSTTLGTRATGEQVNLEVDVLAKYVERLLTAGGPRPHQTPEESA